MKKAGLIILAFGLLITLITGFNHVTKENIIEIGDLEITAEKSETTSWSPMVGVAVMSVGGILFMVGGREK